MADVEGSGKTVEEAIQHGLSQLNELHVGRRFRREDVDIEVLSEGSKGILGMGGEPARVVVRPLEAPVVATAGAAAGGDVAVATGEGDEEEPGEDEAEVAAQTLDHMLEIMGVRADVSIRDPETPGDGLGLVKAVLDIEGDDLGILIGRRGETLASLQYLLNLMMTRQFGQRMAFTVDVEGYRQRRERQLNALARRTAETVRRTKKAVQLEPMPANERRIIHMALAEDRYVTTESSGEGDARQVSVTPR